MSSYAATKINQKEYLKRYLSGDKEKNKKKKKKDKKQKKLLAPKVKIIDDDAYEDNNEDIDEELLFGGEDAPQIVGEYVDVRPMVDKWKSIAVKDEPVDEEKPNGSNENDLWGRKEGVSKIKVEFSPSRTKRSDSKNSPARRNKQDSDHSPPRKSRARSKSRDNSPLRRVKQEPVSPEVRIKQEPRSSSREVEIEQKRRRSRSRDQSPQHRKKNRHSREQSPSLSRANGNSSDLSPPRRKQRSRSGDRSPERRRRLKNTPDQSPPRRSQHGYADSRASSSRQRRNNDDLSPPRRRQRSRSRDQSPKRSRRRSSHGQSPSPPRKSRWAKPEPVKTPSPPPTHAKHSATKTLEGKMAGLQDAQSLKKESEARRRQESQMYEKMSREVSGRDAEVQVRSTGRRGRRAQAAADEDPEERRRKEALEQKKKELYERWGKGVKQVEDQRVRQSEMAHEAAKPLARYADDEDLDRHLREQEHADDPMLEYMRQKRKERQIAACVPSVPLYEGSYPENRFGIRPGYRWDGVNRSNGYENKWFDKQNEKRARQDEAYKYSVEDM